MNTFANMRKDVLLALFSGLILIAAWPTSGLSVLLFVAFVPLLLLTDYIIAHGKSGKRLFLCAYAAFLTWNMGTTWWIYHATFGGALLAFVFNALFMALIFRLFFETRRKLGRIPGYIALVAYWIAFEYLHLSWELSWPWLTLGNGFSESYKWVQWYEYTGVFGGTLWVWLINILLYEALRASSFLRRRLILLSAAILLVLLPVGTSWYRYSGYTEKGEAHECVVIQPNVDPYNEKFSNVPGEDQLAKILQLGSSVADSSVEYFIAPETALPFDHRENDIQQNPDIKTITTFLHAFPKASFITGMSTSRAYSPGEPLSETVRKFPNGTFYDDYNTAVQINQAGKVQFYHKSKLVPGVERMPYPGMFKFVEKFAIDLGGTVGSYGTQKERTPFLSNNGVKVGTPICYESIYGEFLNGFVENGARYIFIITNDGWWGDTPGYKQHMSYARLRAIETRRSIARSANTGISCFINQRGDVLQSSPWWKPEALRAKLKANDELTFYTSHGDYIAKFFACIAIGLMLITFATHFFRKKTDL